MRVIGGTARGRPLKAPRGLRTRPMADKIREAAFSMLWSLGSQPERVLDLYAGSGGVGIEALSRGAVHADFVEGTSAACAVIRQNLRSTGFEDSGNVHQMQVRQFLERVNQSYDLVVMDPPYADPDIADVMRQLSESRAVSDETILLIGHSPRVTLPEIAGRLTRLRERCHGDSCFSIYECAAEQMNDRLGEAG